MATRYYIVGGAYYTWEQLHNQFGYTDHETSNISYKSAHPTTWGESAGSGYFDGDQTDMVNGSFWSDEDNTAWHTLNSLALDVEVYPADATDCAMEKDGVQSDAVSIESDGVTYYLIRNVWDSGWMSESEAAAEGWEPAQPSPVLPVVYTHTGTQTAASIAPDASFDTGLTYDSNNLYIGETDDGLGDVTRYGWEVEEGPEPPAYTEITLYMASGSKAVQTNVTSAFTGNVNSACCYQLYTDEQCTLPWTGYDYSNDYEIWYYYNGEWARQVDSISAMPDYTTTGTPLRTIGFILMDIGYLWAVSNITGSSYNITTSSITLRIYPKAQQQYPLYFSLNSNIYNNYSTSGGTSNGMQHRSGNISYGWMPWSNSFPERTIVNALYSSGKSGVSISRLSFDGTDEMRIRLASGYAPSFRNVIFTLDVPTYTSWANLSGNKSAESNEVCPLFDKNGEYVVYDPTMSYTIIGLFNYSGGHPFSSPNRFMLDAQLGSFDTGNPMRLCFKLNRAVTFSYVWYIKTPITT